jgi:carbon-monoxide dehydrogenase medium subunit
MAIWKTYHLAKSAQDALTALADLPGRVQVIAGGTDLLLELQQGLRPPVDALVDVSAVPEMGIIEVRGERLFVGAAVPLNTIVASPLVNAHASALIEAAALIGGPQVRNTATLGGNVAHALPAADGTIALMAMGAQALVADLGGSREVPMEMLFTGPGKSALDPVKELLLGFLLPMRKAYQGSAFRRVMRPQGVAIAILNTGIWLEREGERIRQARVAIGPAGPVPFRARGAEVCLSGKTVTPTVLAEALSLIHEEVRYRTSPHRATAEYRHQVTDAIFRDAFYCAWERATL